ncbi:fanconi anemia group M protein [Caerostris extrusa]|uniref:Fanconi anemia group M protein n=1 Tax=Caerostris extrusa TaxID=172846 RepID=A0AAV4N0G6_CAEEX|nr:fanconi anemia group M protein [Caerostris extrusa]
MENKIKALKSPELSEALFEPEKQKTNKNIISEVSSKDSLINQIKDIKFKQPISKQLKIDKVKLKNRKKCKKNFLLSQASVSGSESSDCDNVEEDEDLDALEASFIDDDTLLESPQNQHCMYLESVKNIAGLPQNYKFKDANNWSGQHSSQLMNEGCSKYLLDSFCVNDDEVVYTSSSDEEIESKTKFKTVNVGEKKRKRIVIFSESNSSSDESLVKRIKLPEDDSSDEEDFGDVGKYSFVKNSSDHLRKSNIDSFKSDIPPCTKDSSMHVQNKLQKELENVSNDQVQSSNFSFDLDWDDAIPAPELLSEEKNETTNSKVIHVLSNDDSNLTAKFQIKSPVKSNTENLPSVSNNTIYSSSDTSIVSSIKRPNSTVSATFHSNSTFATASSSINRTTDKIILVDSRELASGKPVVSSLRNKYKMNQ